MKNGQKKRTEPPMRKEYNFTNAVIGKYARRYQTGTNLVLLDPDVESVTNLQFRFAHLASQEGS